MARDRELDEMRMEGFGLLAESEFGRALRIGREPTIQDQTPGWDIMSRAYVGKGDLDDSVVPPRISTTYEVVADTEQEAFKLLRPFEPEEIRGSLSVASCEVLRECTGELKGVYEANTYGIIGAR